MAILVVAPNTLMPMRRAAGLVLASLALFGPLSAWAIDDDRIVLRAGITMNSDSNLFRLPPNADPQLYIGATQTNDTSRTETLGMSLNLPYARQRFTADINASKTHYNRFSDLDYDGRDIKGSWLWQAGNDFSGDITGGDSSTLASFNNYQQHLRNIIYQRSEDATLNYQAYPSIRLESGISRLHLTNSAFERNSNDYLENSGQLALKYTPASGNIAGVRLRGNTTSYPNQQIFASSLIDTTYSQKVLEGLFDWRFTGASRVYGQAGVIRRQYRDLSERNFSGGIGSLAFDWMPTAKTSLNLTARRDLSGFQDFTTNYVLLRGITVKPAWAPTVKTLVQLSYDYQYLDYLGDPGFLLGVTDRRADRLRTQGMTIAYQPSRNFQFNLNWQQQRRTSNFKFYEYDARVFSGSLQVQF